MHTHTHTYIKTTHDIRCNIVRVTDSSDVQQVLRRDATMDRAQSVHALHHVQHAALHQVRVDNWFTVLIVFPIVDECLAF